MPHASLLLYHCYYYHSPPSLSYSPPVRSGLLQDMVSMHWSWDFLSPFHISYSLSPSLMLHPCNIVTGWQEVLSVYYSHLETTLTPASGVWANQIDGVFPLWTNMGLNMIIPLYSIPLGGGTLWFHTKYLTHTLEDMIFIKHRNLKSS